MIRLLFNQSFNRYNVITRNTYKLGILGFRLTVRVYNNIPEYIKDLTVNKFKDHIKLFLEPEDNYRADHYVNISIL